MWSHVLPLEYAVGHPLPREQQEKEEDAVESRVMSPDGATDTEVNSYTGVCGSLTAWHNSQGLMCPSGGHVRHGSAGGKE